MPPTQPDSFTRLNNGLLKVMELADRLVQIQSIPDFLRTAVELARLELGTERAGIFLYDEERGGVVGTFGTDHQGNTTDERNTFFPIGASDQFPARYLTKSRPGEPRWRISEGCLNTMQPAGSRPYQDDWIVITQIESSTAVIGLFFNDNAISHGPMDPVTQEIIAHYAFVIGSILARKKAERALLISEEKYRSLFDSNPQPVFLYDLENLKMLAVNDAAVQHYGYTREEFLNLTIRDLEPHEEANESFHRIDIEKTQTHPAGEWKHRHKMGCTIDVEIFTRPVRFEGRKAKLVIAIDIKERKQSRQKIEMLAAFPRVNPNPVLEFDSQGEILFYNEAATEMKESFGLAHVENLLPPDYKAIVKNCLATMHKKARCEMPIGERTISWSFFPVSERNTVHCYGGEITDRLALEAQFRQAQKMESIGQLAGGVAHDFNNILTAIMGYANLIRLRPGADHQTLEDAEQITLAAERAANLTRQLLTFSRRQVASLSEVDLNASIRNIESMLRSLLGESVLLQCQCAENLPLIHADANMIDQIILNLAVNARDAMEEAGGTLTISTTTRQIGETDHSASPSALKKGEWVVLSIRDTGTGMDEATMTKIFEPFFTTKGLGKGTGLGLSTVYGIVNQHKGWIDIDSHLGKGTTFHVHFPPCESTPTQAGSPLKNAADQRSLRILVVDDEPAIRTIAKTILERKNHHVVMAANPNDAISLLKEAEPPFDLVLTDIIMPNHIPGNELATQLWEEQPGLKIIFTSGYNIDELPTRPQANPLTTFLPKPYTAAELIKAVETIMASRHTG